MVDIANYGLIIAGLIPVVISAIKLEKYYTNYFTGLWNIYGSILIILGFILDEDVDRNFLAFGIISIVLLSLLGILSPKFNHPELIRLFGRSTFQCSLDLFFIVLFFSSQLYLAICLSIFAFLILYITAYFSGKRSRLRYKIKNNEMNVGSAAKIIKKFNDEFPVILLPYVYFIIFSLAAWKIQGFIQADFVLGLIVFITISIFSAYYLFDAYSFMQSVDRQIPSIFRNNPWF